MTFALVEILGDALVGVIADALVEADRLLRHHAQAALQPGNGHADIGVNMHGAVHVRPRAQDAAVQRESGPVDAGFLVEVLVHRDLHEIGRGDLGVEQIVLLHQKFARLARHPHGGMVVDDVVPTVMRGQPVDGGEIDARLPFCR